MDQTLAKLHKLLPGIVFKDGNTFCWSPMAQEVTYCQRGEGEIDTWALLHEAGHAALKHTNYKSDFELLLLEVAAWEKAAELGNQIDVKIDTDHIQDCLDTYRDWLHQRSTCPTCSNTCFQLNQTTYRCHNCNTEWTVTSSRFCRAYRKKKLNTKIEKRPLTSSTTFL